MEASTLREHWLRDTNRSQAASNALDELVARYREPHRHYHTVTHLERVLDDVVALLGAEGRVPDPAAVRLAAFFHDAVYDPRSTTNEADSAALARRELADLGVAADTVDEVARLVLATASHLTADDDLHAAILLDADLAVLGADPAVYAAYVTGVRSEYGFVDDDAWRAGRAAVLRSFLGREHLYRTATMAHREQRARANLTAELATLDDD